MKLSVQGTSRLYIQEQFVVLISGRACVNPKVILRPTGLCKWKISNDTIGNRTRTFRLVVQCLNQLYLRVLEKKHQLFFCSHLLNQCCQPSDVLRCNSNLYDSYGKVMYSTQVAWWYRLLTSDRGTGSDPSICFDVTSRVLPPKQHKINKRTCNV